MDISNATATPVDTRATWAVRSEDEHTWRDVTPGAGFDVFLHYRDGQWCAREVFRPPRLGIPGIRNPATGLPAYRVIPATVYHGRVIAFSGDGHVLVMEDSRRLVVLPATAVYAVPECP